jgi:hypothetical protein
MRIDKSVPFALFCAGKGRIIGAAMLSTPRKSKISDSMLQSEVDHAIHVLGRDVGEGVPIETTPLPKGVVASADTLRGEDTLRGQETVQGKTLRQKTTGEPTRTDLSIDKSLQPLHASATRATPMSEEDLTDFCEGEKIFNEIRQLMREVYEDRNEVMLPVNCSIGVYIAAYLDERCDLSVWERVVRENDTWSEAVALMIVRYGGLSFGFCDPLKVSVNPILYYFPSPSNMDA